MTFQDRVKEHLADYKREVMNVHEDGINGNRGYKKPYPHILPVGKREMNIIEYYRDDFYNSAYERIKFHECYHHLNSSQALCFNLFYPLIYEQKLNVILELLGLPVIKVRTAEFEKLSPLEQTSNGKTNFDFYIELTDGTRIFFEIKYTEDSFGGTKHDKSHIRKFKKTYLPLLQNNPYIREEYKTVELFLQNYQIMRNLAHLGEKNYVIFLYPPENLNIHKQATLAYDEMVTEKGRERLQIHYLKDIVQHILNNSVRETILNHFREFEEKYFTLKH